MPSGTDFITLSDACSLKLMEVPCVYNKETDDLYELDDKALEFLKSCDGSKTLLELGGDDEFVDYCFKEGILTASGTPSRRRFVYAKQPARSLRYLELHLTDRCNLHCRHCYLGAGKGAELELSDIFRTMDEFDTMYGLRLLVSGGEPMLHKRFWYINERVRDYGFRSVLLTNGTLITKDAASRLKFHEAQVSLDGMKVAHNLLRGEGSFERTMYGIDVLRSAGIRVSVATIVTAINRYDFEPMKSLLESLGVSEWNVDVPSMTGRFMENPGLLLPAEESAGYLSYSYGGGYHGGTEGYGCGYHLCAVGPAGQVAKCGFYFDRAVGNIKEGLSACWNRISPVNLDLIKCDCAHKDECRAGCRYRASVYGGEFGPDPVRCHFHGVGHLLPKGGESNVDKEGREGLRQHM